MPYKLWDLQTFLYTKPLIRIKNLVLSKLQAFILNKSGYLRSKQEASFTCLLILATKQKRSFIKRHLSSTQEKSHISCLTYFIMAQAGVTDIIMRCKCPTVTVKLGDGDRIVQFERISSGI